MEYNASKSVGLLNIFRMNRYAGLHGNLAEGRIKSLPITKPNQVVFSSINYGTDTSAEGRLVIKELLTCTMQGVGNGATAIFPIHVMKMKEGVNKNPGDPNYDLYKMSWAVTARRFFPNYLNLDATFNRDDRWRADDPLRYNYEVATMG